MIASPLRPRDRQESGIAAAGRLAPRGTPYGASLSFATTTHLWPLPDPPSRKLRSATSRTGAARSIPGRALASSVLDSPCQGSKTGLPPPISTSVPSTPTQALALRARPSRRQPRHAIQPGDQATSTSTTTDAKWGQFRPSRWGQCKSSFRLASPWRMRPRLGFMTPFWFTGLLVSLAFASILRAGASAATLAQACRFDQVLTARRRSAPS